MHLFYLKPNYTCMLCFTLIVYHFLMFQVPLNNLTATDLWNRLPYLFLAFFCLQLLSSTSALPFSPTCERKHAVNFPQHLRVTSYTADLTENVYQLLQL